MGKFTPLDTTSPVHGDAELAEKFLSTLGNRRVYALAIVSVAEGATRLATVGAEHDARFELGSVSKAINGHILASMIADGTVNAAQTLGSLLPLGECPASDVALEELATHTSGLPAHGGSRLGVWRKGLRAARGREADTETVEELFGQLRRASPQKQRYHYSNLGGAALGTPSPPPTASPIRISCGRGSPLPSPCPRRWYGRRISPCPNVMCAG